MSYKYKYTKAITIGHRPDGSAIRKYFKANTKKELNQKMLAHQEEQDSPDQIGRSVIFW